MDLPHGLCANLAKACLVLVSNGYSPSFLLMFDEAWLLGLISTNVAGIASGNAPIGDWLIFYVQSGAQGYKPGPPHRDRPLAGVTSFRQDTNAPMLVFWFLMRCFGKSENKSN